MNKPAVAFSPEHAQYRTIVWRGRAVVVLVGAAFAVLIGRAFYVQVLDAAALRKIDNEQSLRTVKHLTLQAERGKILDRNGGVLASSAPYYAAWVKRSEFDADAAQLASIAQTLKTTSAALAQQLNANTETIYLARQLNDEQVAQLRSEKIKGLRLTQEYRRLYPLGEAAAPLIGYLTSGNEAKSGIELLTNARLLGEEGQQRVMVDGRAKAINTLEGSTSAEAGKDIKLTIHKDLQVQLFEEVKAGVLANGAKGGTGIVVDANSGDILALASYPSYDPSPEARKELELLRITSFTDPFEPGSTVKPFTVALALNKGLVKPDTVIAVGGKERDFKAMKVKDHHAMGNATVSTILQHSSNIGTTLIAKPLSTDEMHFWLSSLGFGQPLNLGFSKTSSGRVLPAAKWGETGKITAGYGYGFNATLAHLARAYTALGNQGVLQPLRLVQTSAPSNGQRVMQAEVANSILTMLEAATQEGTGTRAQVEHYRVGGKTGTAKKLVTSSSGKKVYSDNKFITSFVGLAPISAPRLITAISIDEPDNPKASGGLVAAPIFSRVMAYALRTLSVSPDAPNKAVVLAPVVEESN